MKQNNKFWKFIGGGHATSILLGSTLLPLSFLAYQTNQISNNTKSVNSTHLGATKVIPSNEKEVDADSFFSDASATGKVYLTLESGDTNAATIESVSNDFSIGDLAIPAQYTDTDPTPAVTYNVTKIATNAFFIPSEGTGGISGTIDFKYATYLTQIDPFAFSNYNVTSKTITNKLAFYRIELGSMTTDIPCTAFTGSNFISSVQVNESNSKYEEWVPDDKSGVLVDKNTWKGEWENSTYALGGIAWGDIDLSSFTFGQLASTAFTSSYIHSIKLPETLMSINGDSMNGVGPFMGCQNDWHEVVIPANVTSIGYGAFVMCGKVGETGLNKVFRFENRDASWVNEGLNRNWLEDSTIYASTDWNYIFEVYEKAHQAYLDAFSDKGYSQGNIYEFALWYDDNESNLGLILGLSLGIGIPVVAGATVGIVFGVKKHKKNKK